MIDFIISKRYTKSKFLSFIRMLLWIEHFLYIFFSLNLLNIIVLKENRNVFVLEKLSPLPLSPQVTVWSGAEIITLLQTSSFWWIWNQISSVSTLNMLLLSIKLLIGVEIKMLVFSDNVPLVTACSCWEQKKFFWLKILLNFWMVVSILQCFNQNVFYWNQGKIQLFFQFLTFHFWYQFIQIFVLPKWYGTLLEL